MDTENKYVVGQKPDSVKDAEEMMKAIYEQQKEALKQRQKEHTYAQLLPPLNTKKAIPSKTAAAKARAKKKIAKASRQRNRR